MELPLDKRLSIGLQTIHRRAGPAKGPWLPRIDEMCALVELIDQSGGIEGFMLEVIGLDASALSIIREDLLED